MNEYDYLEAWWRKQDLGDKANYESNRALRMAAWNGWLARSAFSPEVEAMGDSPCWPQSHDANCESIEVDIGVGNMHSPCGCEVRWYQRALRAVRSPPRTPAEIGRDIKTALEKDYPSKWLMRHEDGHEWETSDHYTSAEIHGVQWKARPVKRIPPQKTP